MKKSTNPIGQDNGVISKASLILMRNSMLVVALLFGFTFVIFMKTFPATPAGDDLIYTTADYEGRQTKEEQKRSLLKDALKKNNKREGGPSGGWGISIGDNY